VSTSTSEPGTRLGGRYRLEDRVAAAAGWAAWKAIDETLARAVTVLTFAPGFPPLREVVTAARAASRLNDPRFAQVFDVEDDWDHAYIVTEWAAGDSLDDMLGSGPLDAARGARIIAEAAEAISAAHAAGLAHLCLNPDSLRWTPGGGVKITGLGIDAALSGASADDPAAADTRRLGMLLYAALTGHWPGPDCPTLPPAPLADGIPCSPRQVRAGVPAALDAITSQTLMLGKGDGYALTTPDDLASALLAAIPPVPLPQLPPSPAPRPAAARSRGSSYRGGPRPEHPDLHPQVEQYLYPEERDPEYWTRDSQRTRAVTHPGSPPRRSGEASTARGFVIVALVVVVAAGLAIVAVHSLRNRNRGKSPPPAALRHPATAKKPTTPVARLIPVSAQAFEDNPVDADLAIDNNPGSAWETYQYRDNPVFGGLQQGSGLILNMGRQVSLSSLQATFESEPGANVEIKIGNPSDPSPPPDNAALAESIANSMTTVAQRNGVSGTVTFTSSSSATGRYILIWFTKLAPMASNPNEYQGAISDVVVTGRH
jgi:eukaryotic-like serine/threonine-protein kinase